MIINVKVKPNSKINELKNVGENKYIASIKEPPEKDKANKELIKLLSKELGIDFRKINIKNPSSRNKIIEITYDKM